MSGQQADLKQVTHESLEKFLTMNFSLSKIEETIHKSGLDESKQKEAFDYVKEIGLSTLDTQIFDEASKMHNEGKSHDEIECHFKKFNVYEDIHQLVAKTLKHLGKQDVTNSKSAQTASAGSHDKANHAHHSPNSAAQHDSHSAGGESNPTNDSSGEHETTNKKHYGWVIFIILSLGIGLFIFGKARGWFS